MVPQKQKNKYRLPPLHPGRCALEGARFEVFRKVGGNRPIASSIRNKTGVKVSEPSKMTPQTAIDKQNYIRLRFLGISMGSSRQKCNIWQSGSMRWCARRCGQAMRPSLDRSLGLWDPILILETHRRFFFIKSCLGCRLWRLYYSSHSQSDRSNIPDRCGYSQSPFNFSKHFKTLILLFFELSILELDPQSLELRPVASYHTFESLDSWEDVSNNLFPDGHKELSIFTRVLQICNINECKHHEVEYGSSPFSLHSWVLRISKIFLILGNFLECVQTWDAPRILVDFAKFHEIFSLTIS